MQEVKLKPLVDAVRKVRRGHGRGLKWRLHCPAWRAPPVVLYERSNLNGR